MAELGTGIVSMDDHVIEPPDLWTSRLPTGMADRAPTLVRERGAITYDGRGFVYEPTDDGTWADVWYFGDVRSPLIRTIAAAGTPSADVKVELVTMDDIRKGCYDQVERLADMDRAGIDASLCFPNLFVRFCGQRFLEEPDRDLALACLRAYNDWMLDEWCAGSAGRLIPLGLVPLWDPQAAADEVRALAERGCRAVTFPEIPAYLGLPSVHTDGWDPLFAACEKTGVVLNLHIGSGSKTLTTSPDAPAAVLNSITFVNPAMALADWIFSGKLDQFRGVRLSFAECQIGWIPFVLERAEAVWDKHRSWSGASSRVTRSPREVFAAQIACCFFDDDFGIEVIDHIGVGNVMFETDYPHADTTWPASLEVADRALRSATPAVREQVIRGNALAFLDWPDPALTSVAAS